MDGLRHISNPEGKRKTTSVFFSGYRAASRALVQHMKYSFGSVGGVGVCVGGGMVVGRPPRLHVRVLV